MLAAACSLILAFTALLAGLAERADAFHPAGEKIFGVSEANSWRTAVPRATPDQLAGLLSELGAESQRWQIDWDSVEGSPPTGDAHAYDFSAFDVMYEADLARGIRPLIIIANPPRWARAADAPSGPGWGFPPGIEHLDDWAAFCRAVAERYGDAAGFEVWNEPNHPYYWGRGQVEFGPDPVHYARILESAHEAIKSVDPSLTVIGGALAGFSVTEPGRQVTAFDFASAILAQGAAANMDAISVHVYPEGWSGGDSAPFADALQGVRTALDGAGASIPIWVTEMGVTTTGSLAATESDQATELLEFFDWATRQPDVAAFYLHTLSEPNQDPSDAEKGYAITTGSAYPFAPKPAFVAIRNAAREFHDREGDSPASTATGAAVWRPGNSVVRQHLVIRGRRVQAAVHKGHLTAWVRTNASGRILRTARVTTTSRRALRLGGGRQWIAAGRARQVRFRLNGGSRRALATALGRGAHPTATLRIATPRGVVATMRVRVVA